jgi:hypothetical protein
MGMGAVSCLSDAKTRSARRNPAKTSPGNWERISSVKDIEVNSNSVAHLDRIFAEFKNFT